MLVSTLGSAGIPTAAARFAAASLTAVEAARDSNKMLARLTGLGEERANAVTLSGMQLASSLLRRGQRSKSSLQMSDPRASLRHLCCGIGEQARK